MTIRASSAILRTRSAAGSISATSPTTWPASRPICSISPLASRFGGMPKRWIGISRPAIRVCPMIGSSARSYWPRFAQPVSPGWENDWPFGATLAAQRRLEHRQLGAENGRSNLRTVKLAVPLSIPLGPRIMNVSTI